MKKFLMSLLAAVFVFSLAACAAVNSSEGETSSGSTKENQSETKETAIYEAGVWSDNVYTNSSLGITFNLPEGWSYGTSEELAALQSQGSEIAGTSEEEMDAVNDRMIYDFYIYSADGSENVIMMAEDLSKYGDITAKQYIDIVSAQLTGLDSEAVSYEISDTKEIKLGNSTFVTMAADAVYSGVNVHQYYAVTEMSGQLITMIITAPAENCDTFIDSIQAVK